jgi:hypothetical protein
MALDMQIYLLNRRRFLENRPQFPPEQLLPYAGRWVAWSPDGTSILVDSDNPELLEDLVRAAGEDPVHCVVEAIPAGDTLLSGVLTAEGL